MEQKQEQEQEQKCVICKSKIRKKRCPICGVIIEDKCRTVCEACEWESFC